MKIKHTYTLPTKETIENPTLEQMKSILVKGNHAIRIKQIEKQQSEKLPANSEIEINTNWDGKITIRRIK